MKIESDYGSVIYSFDKANPNFILIAVCLLATPLMYVVFRDNIGADGFAGDFFRLLFLLIGPMYIFMEIAIDRKTPAFCYTDKGVLIFPSFRFGIRAKKFIAWSDIKDIRAKITFFKGCEISGQDVLLKDNSSERMTLRPLTKDSGEEIKRKTISCLYRF